MVPGCNLWVGAASGVLKHGVRCRHLLSLGARRGSLDGPLLHGHASALTGKDRVVSVAWATVTT